MSSGNPDNRRYRRIYFPGQVAVHGVVAAGDSSAEFPVKVLNLSEGGLFFTTAKENGRYFQEKGRVLLKGMQGPDPFNLGENMHMEIKWVLGDTVLESIGYGCEFIDPPSRSVELLRAMVDGFSLDAAR